MPHLSPMQWLMTMILLWVSLLLIMSKHWWLQLPKFYTAKTLKAASSQNWYW